MAIGRFLIVFLAAFPLVCLAQGFSGVPLEADAEQLPARFRGHDLDALVKAISRIPNLKPKDEFESTAQFEERVQKARTAKLLGSLTIGDVIAIKLPSDAIRAKYDADKQTLSVGWAARSWHGDTGGGFKQATIKIHRQVVGSYVAANAFNRKVTVQRVRGTDMSVVFEWGRSFDQACLAEELAVPLAEAKSAKEDLSVFLVGTPNGQFIHRGMSRSGPTIDYPLDLETMQTGLEMTLSGIWIVNQKTGKILKKTIPSMDSLSCIAAT